MSLVVKIVFYSMYGHIYQMAKAIAEGVEEVEGVKAEIYQVPEVMDKEALEAAGAAEAKKAFADVPVIEPDQLAEADGIIFGTPTRFGNMAGQMRNFLDRTGGLWMKGALIGKPGGVFTSTATQHGGQETTLASFHTTLLHHGMLVVGVPYSEQKQMTIEEMSGGSPYGATTITGGDGSRMPSDNELAIARFQGKHLAEIVKKLSV
jgi:NAD(P)H dehydrogenase (quinone)